MEKSIDNWQNAQDKVEKTGAQAKKYMKEKAQETQDTADQALQYVQQGWDVARRSSTQAVEYSESMIKSHPFIAIAGAVAVGAILGAALTRRSY